MQNRKQYTEMKERLEKVGVYLSVEYGKLSLYIPGPGYETATKRRAGRKEKRVCKNRSEYDPKPYLYSDVIELMKAHKNEDIIEMLGMPRMTFYRHLKKMKESAYYEKAVKLHKEDPDAPLPGREEGDRPF